MLVVALRTHSDMLAVVPRTHSDMLVVAPRTRSDMLAGITLVPGHRVYAMLARAPRTQTVTNLITSQFSRDVEYTKVY